MEQKMTGMDFKIREVAQRIRELREMSTSATCWKAAAPSCVLTT